MKLSFVSAIAVSLAVAVIDASTTLAQVVKPWYKQVTNPTGDVTADAVTITYPSFEATMPNVSSGHIFLQLMNVQLGVGNSVGLNPGSDVLVHGNPPTGVYHVRFTFAPNGQTSSVSIRQPGGYKFATCTIASGSQTCEAVFYYNQGSGGLLLDAWMDTGYPLFASVYIAPTTYGQ